MSILIPSNKQGLEDVREEVETHRLDTDITLQSIDRSLKEITLHLRILTGETPHEQDDLR